MPYRVRRQLDAANHFASLMHAVATTVHFPDHARELRRLATLRCIYGLTGEIRDLLRLRKQPEEILQYIAGSVEFHRSILPDPASRRFVLHDAASACVPLPEAQPIVRGLLHRNSLNGIVADPGMMKTLLCMDLGTAVAAGDCWLHFDTEQARAFARDPANMRDLAARARAHYPLIPPRWGLGRTPSSSVLYINHAGTRDLGQFDGTDPEDLTRAEALSRRQALQMVAAMREYGGEALQGIELVATGPQIGVRETRRVKGPYVLTEEDAVEGRQFEDVVAWRSGFLDIGFVRLEEMRIHDVPYRALLPERVEGLLVAGRCISATHVAASAGKSMGNCVATGHAAGLAAAMSVRRGCTPRQMDVAALQQALRRDGVDLNRGGEEQQIRS